MAYQQFYSAPRQHLDLMFYDLSLSPSFLATVFKLQGFCHVFPYHFTILRIYIAVPVYLILPFQEPLQPMDTELTRNQSFRQAMIKVTFCKGSAER